MKLDFVNYTKLSLEEHIQLLEIRNQEYVRKNMKNDKIIKLQDHLSWIKVLKEDHTKIYYAIFSEGRLVGGINITDIDLYSKTSSWGLFMQNNLNPMIPTMSTYLIIEKIFNELCLDNLNLEVNKQNMNAYKFDKNFGFIDNGEYINGGNAYYLMTMNKTAWESNKTKGLLKIVKTKLNNSSITFKN